MKSIRRSSLFRMLVLAIAAMGASATPAHAQTITGSFSLAHKVRWAGAVLPPGDYEFSLDSQNWPARVTVRQAGGCIVAMVLPRSISDNQSMSASSLVLHQEGGESVVRTLRLKDNGLALQFAWPKLATPVAETAGLEPIADSQPAK
jgi:hypothetical protein